MPFIVTNGAAMGSISRLMTKFSRSEVDYLFLNARRTASYDAFNVLCAPRSREQSFSKVLIIIAKRTGSAPQRNKVRRRLKAIFYQNRLYQQPFHCIVIAKKAAVHKSYQELAGLMERGIQLATLKITCNARRVQ
jgi:ribonuclease P protein component